MHASGHLREEVERHLMHLHEQLAQLRSGGITTREVPGGIMVDTTADTIQKLEGYIRTFESLLADQVADTQEPTRSEQ